MSRRLSPLQSRTLAVGLLLLALSLVYTGLIGPYLGAFAESRDRIANLQYQLVRHRAMIDRRGELSERLEQLRALPQFTSFLLTQSTPNLAAAELENRVRNAVAQREGRMLSMQMVPTTPTPEGLLPVTITINAKGTIETVHSLFHTLESGSPLLFLDNVEVTQARGSRSRYPRMTTPPQLDIRFNLTGYVRTKEGEGA